MAGFDAENQPQVDTRRGKAERAGGLDFGAVEVLVASRRRWAALALVSISVCSRTVGVLSGRGKLEEAELTNFGTGPKLDRQRSHIRELQRYVPRESWVDKTSRRVRQKSQPAQRGLAFQASSDVVGQGYGLICGAQDKLTRMQNKGLIRSNFDQSSQLGLLLGRINVRIFVVVEKPEQLVDPHVHA